jgi:hypothetical protein
MSDGIQEERGGGGIDFLKCCSAFLTAGQRPRFIGPKMIRLLLTWKGLKIRFNIEGRE